jgi:hypothetical protein
VGEALTGLFLSGSDVRRAHRPFLLLDEVEPCTVLRTSCEDGKGEWAAGIVALCLICRNLQPSGNWIDLAVATQGLA